MTCRLFRTFLFLVALSSTAMWPVFATTDATPPDNNVVYQIFVRSFADGDDPDTVGDLKGLTAKLDYLNDGKPETDNDLEVGVLWLMPIFPSTTYHGYDVKDYENVNPEYGTLDDFRAFAAAAHARGMRVILDIPLNHTSRAHPWFQEAVDNPDSPRRKFYFIEPAAAEPRSAFWHTIAGRAGTVRYFGLFDPLMPDLNFDNPDVRREVMKIADSWLDLGVDGFRLDAAKHIYGDTFKPTDGDIRKNNEFWREFSEHVYQKHPQAILVGEVLGEPDVIRRHAFGLNALLDEPFMNCLRDQVVRPQTGFLAARKLFLEQARRENDLGRASGASRPPFDMFLFAASHDRDPRLASELQPAAAADMSRASDEAYRLAMCILLLTGRHVVLYNGDEIMQRGYKWNGNPKDDPDKPGDGSGIFDETLREPFPWFRSSQGPGQTAWRTDFLPKFDSPNDGVSVEEQQGPDGMLSLVRGLINLRNKHPALDQGEMGDILNDSDRWMVFERTKSGDDYLVLCNLASEERDYRFHADWYPKYRNARMVYWSDGRHKTWKDATEEVIRIQDSVKAPPSGAVVLRRVGN